VPPALGDPAWAGGWAGGPTEGPPSPPHAGILIPFSPQPGSGGSLGAQRAPSGVLLTSSNRAWGDLPPPTTPVPRSPLPGAEPCRERSQLHRSDAARPKGQGRAGRSPRHSSWSHRPGRPRSHACAHRRGDALGISPQGRPGDSEQPAPGHRSVRPMASSTGAPSFPPPG